jgi:predicted secreted protein
MHSFHLRTGEMTVMLEDMAMTLALPIEGTRLCIDTSCDDWRGKMVDLIGKCPGDTLNKDGVKLRVAAGATFKWISDNFNTCPEDADEDVVKMHTRV